MSDVLERESIPKTVPEAIDRLYSEISEEDKDFLRNLDNPDHPEIRKWREVGMNPKGMLHHGAMMGVRNRWIHTDPDQTLVNWTRETYGVGHADDVSRLIQDGLLAKLKGEACDFATIAERSRAHWAIYGCDPLTGERLPHLSSEEGSGGTITLHVQEDGVVLIPDIQVTGRTPADRPNRAAKPSIGGFLRRLFKR